MMFTTFIKTAGRIGAQQLRTELTTCIKYEGSQCSPKAAPGNMMKQYDNTLFNKYNEANHAAFVRMATKYYSENEKDKEQILAYLKQTKTPHVLLNDFWPANATSVIKIRKLILPHVPINDYFTGHAYHIIRYKLIRDDLQRLKLVEQVITSCYSAPQPNMMHIEDTKIPNTKMQGATTAVQTKVNIYYINEEQALFVIKHLNDEKFKNPEMQLKQERALASLFKEMEGNHIPKIKELEAKRLLTQEADLLAVNQKLQAAVFSSLNSFFKNQNVFEPNTEQLFHRLHKHLTYIKLNPRFRLFMETEFSNFIYLRKLYTPREYGQELVRLKQAVTVELLHPYYEMSTESITEKRFLEANVLAIIKGIFNQSKTKWYA